jgi:hypothetical protein
MVKKVLSRGLCQRPCGLIVLFVCDDPDQLGLSIDLKGWFFCSQGGLQRRADIKEMFPSPSSFGYPFYGTFPKRLVVFP